MKPGQDPLQEVVAELSAQALCRMVGKQAQGHYRQQLQIHPGLRRETQTQPPSRLPEGHV